MQDLYTSWAEITSRITLHDLWWTSKLSTSLMKRELIWTNTIVVNFLLFSWHYLLNFGKWFELNNYIVSILEQIYELYVETNICSKMRLLYLFVERCLSNLYRKSHCLLHTEYYVSILKTNWLTFCTEIIAVWE